MASGKKTTLAQRQRNANLIAAVLVLIGSGVLAWLLRNSAQADAADGWWLRARFSLREKLQPPVPDREIVLVELDDRSVGLWKEPLILWGPHLAAAIDRATKGGARMIALDWIQPESVNKWFPGHDKSLGDALSRAPNVVMVKEWASGSKAWIKPAPELLFSLPDSALDPDAHLGYAELSGRDSIVASLMPAIESAPGEVQNSFAARIAQRVIGAPAKLTVVDWKIPGDKGRPGIEVPLRDDGSILINYRSGTGLSGKRSAFQRFSLYDIAQPSSAPDTRFKDKIVLIGATYAGFNDLHYVPFMNGISMARNTPGVEVQANLLRTLLDAQPIDEPGPHQVVLLCLMLTALTLFPWLRLEWVPSAVATVVVLAGWTALSFGFFVSNDFALPLFAPVTCALMASVVIGGYRALGGERQRRQVLGLWGRYQDPRLVEYLLEHSEARGGQGTEMEVTVLFADLKNFTKTVQHLEPAAALQVLNRYLALMTDIIRDEYGGLVDKYLGDGLMAQWGAPQLWDARDAAPEDHHAVRAVRACLELQRRAAELSREVAGAQDVTFGLRLTLHTGPVVVGWVGAERIEFTIIGDTVNVCARLQETAKELGCEFLISESTFQHVSGFVQTGKQAEMSIRGRDKPLTVFEITSETAPVEKKSDNQGTNP